MQRSSRHDLARVLSFAGWAVYAYVFMEWLFFATMPSFMSSMGWLERAGVLFLAAFVIGVPVVLLAGLLGLLSHRLAAIVPAIVLALLALILLDNFTYTLFKVGIVTSTGVWRAAYAVGFLVAAGLLWRWVTTRRQIDEPRDRGLSDYALLALGAVSL